MDTQIKHNPKVTQDACCKS